MEKGTQLARVLNYYGLYFGANKYKIVCPFHDDRNPSLNIDLNSGNFYCFGCGTGGEALDFVMAAEQKDELQDCIKFYKILRSKESEKIEIKTNGKSAKHNEKNSEKYLNAYNYYYCLSKTDWTKETQEIDTLLYMIKRGFTCDVLNKTGARLTYINTYPIIFPIMDNGKFKGWVCRTTNPEVEQIRKYLYNSGFRRANTIVGNYDEKHIPIICEGYLDRLSFLRMGCDPAVSILGWKITQEQIQKLKDKGIKKVVSALDNDTCGRKGTEYLKQFFEVVEFPFPEDVKDVGEMNNKEIRKALRKINYIYY